MHFIENWLLDVHTLYYFIVQHFVNVYPMYDVTCTVDVYIQYLTNTFKHLFPSVFNVTLKKNVVQFCFIINEGINEV